MAANIASTIDPYQKMTNLLEYVHLKTVRLNTSLIGGKIFYEGKEYTEQDYNDKFPEAILKYDIENADSTSIEK